MKKPIHAFPRVVLSTLASALILQSAVSYADDTEIFFGGPAIDSSVRPNVLFVLDNSGSMAWSTEDSDPPNATGEVSRISVLKESFSDLITNADSINAGIMVLNPRSEYGNSILAYPITNIDQVLSSTSPSIASEPQILISGDDASQSNQAMARAVIDSPNLPMGYFTSLGSANSSTVLLDEDAFSELNGNACSLQPFKRAKKTPCLKFDREDRRELTLNSDAALLLFRNLNIPANVTVTSATLTLKPRSDVNYYTGIYIRAERNKTPSALNDNSPFSRSLTDPRQVVAPAPWSSNRSINLDVTQEITANQTIAPSNDAIQSALFSVYVDRNEHASDRTICMRTSSNCSTADLPTLTITYSSNSPGTVEQSTALRFQNVGIPQGATITSARIDMVPAASNSNSLTLAIRAEASADASAFTNTTDLTSRSKTSAVVNWSVPAWVQANPQVHVAGPDVVSLVQEVVNRSDWCGNNAMAFHLTPSGGSGSRTAVSIDGANGLQPRLTVQYTGGEGRCINPILETRISQQKNDAWENDNNSRTVDLLANPLPLDRNYVGARFDNLPIAKNAEVLDAQVVITPDSTVASPSLDVGLRFEDSANSQPFTSSPGNLNGRSKTTSRTCAINSAGGGWTEGRPYICAPSGLKSDLQAIFAKSAWAPGNAVSLFLTPAADSTLNIRSYEDVPAESITLRIKLRSGGRSEFTKTVRQELNATVQAMLVGSGTPVVPTMDEAVKYYRGLRSGTSAPMTSACQPNHLVLLTDGQANSNTDTAKSSIASLAGTCDDNYDDGEVCGRELSEFIYGNDLSSTLDGKQNVTVHTIGFALDSTSNADDIKQFLRDIASPVAPDNPNKSAYTAADATELNDAFNRIIQSVISVDTTFVSPGATVNQFNRQSNKNEVYFALFKPGESNRWIGNVKRYALNSGAGDIILDADGAPAIDSATGFFRANARSYWTQGDDGNNTAQGGVAAQLPASASRKAYTYLGNSPLSPVNLNASQYLLNTANTNITHLKLGLKDRASERDSVINWLRGFDDVTGTERKAIGDPLHSVPRLVTYRCNSYTDATYETCASEDQSVFVGTNEGFVHAFDTNNGAEQMAFMPEDLLGNVAKLRDNARSTSNNKRPYGMDNTVVTWVNDINKNGVIYGGKNPNSATPALLSGLNTGEFVYAYATMGRGGRNLYSLDVSDLETPKLRWFITPATPGFARIGQTWSAPVITKIKIGNTEKPVIMFAGGYDDTQDNVSIRDWNGMSKTDSRAGPRSEDAMGNAIYIVDALTGELIWSGSSEVTNASAQSHQYLSKMKYSMPGGLRVIDINRDGYADQFFIGDMGGQVWRFFINNGNAVGSIVSPLDSGAGSTDDGVLASVIPADSGSETDAQLKSKLRRFYNEPDVALLTVNSGKALVINIGSGFRGHPLDTNADDRFYSFRTPIIENNATHSILTESDMYDATANLIQEGSASEKAAATTAFGRNTGGWYIKLNERDGEKVLSRALTFAGQVFFSTYEPGNNEPTVTCKAVQGTGRSYAVNLFDATPTEQRVNGSPDRSDRVKVLKTAGIPPDAVALFPEGKEKAPLCIGTECEDLEVDISVGPTYWIDEK